MDKYKEEHFDKAGAAALYKALSEANDAVIKSGTKKRTAKKPAKKPANKSGK